MTQLEDIQQEDAMYPWLVDGCMADNFLDQNYNADLLDAMADMAREQEEAMRLDEYLIQATEEIMAETAHHQYQAMTESNQDEWEGVIHDNEDS